MLDRFTGAPVARQPVRQRREPQPSATSTPTATATSRDWPSARDGTLWSAEHGPDRDDEVNLLSNGGDYGWNPVPGYNESVPMTDQGLPGKQIAAAWSSGFPTVATSGASFVAGQAGAGTAAPSRSRRSRPARCCS